MTRRGFAAAAAGLLLAAGCGSSASTVTGVVTLDGQPLTTGTVTFTPLAGGGPPAYGTIGPGGRYSLSVGSEVGLPPGEYGAGVVATEEVKNWDISKGAEPPPKLVTPAKYRDGKTSGLTFTVQPGANSIDLRLTSK